MLHIMTFQMHPKTRRGTL